MGRHGNFHTFFLCTLVVKHLAEMQCQRNVVKFWNFWGSDQFFCCCWFCKMSLVFLFQTLSYNRHNLTADTSERQAKEILIRRRHSLRESLRKDSSLKRGRRVRRWAGAPPRAARRSSGTEPVSKPLGCSLGTSHDPHVALGPGTHRAARLKGSSSCRIHTPVGKVIASRQSQQMSV